MTMLYEAMSMPYARHPEEGMMYGFLIVLVPITFVTYESSSILTLHQTVQYCWGMITPVKLKVLDL